MPKTITIDNGVATQIRVSTDSAGSVHVYCDYVLNSGTTLIEALSQDVTQLLSSSDQSSALTLFNDVLQALGSSQGVTMTGPTPIVLPPAPHSPPLLQPTPTSTPSAVAKRPGSGH